MSCFEQSVLRLFEATRAEWLATAREVAYRQSRRARCHFRPVAVFQLRVNRSNVGAQNAGVNRE